MHRVLPLVGCVFATISSALAGAQTATSTGPGPSDAEIVVTGERAITATKTDTPLIETPQAISVVPAQLIQDRTVVNLQETLRYSAGVAAESYGTDQVADSIFVRGFYPAIYLDGMLRNLSYTGIPRIEPYLLDRVEVLRGPASILYGQGGSGGIINSITKRPRFETGGEIFVDYGTFDRKQVRADVTGPLDAAGTIAARFVGLYRDADQQTDFLKDDRILAAPSLTWRPGSDTSVTLLGTYQRDKNGSSQQFLPVASTRLLGGPGIPLERFLGEPDFDRQLTRQWTVTAAIEQRFTPELVLRSNSRYGESKVAFDEIFPDVYSNPTDPFLDPARRVVGRVATSRRSRVRTFTTDNILQWSVDTGPFRHTLIGGVDYLYFYERQFRGDADAAPIDVYAPVYGNLPTIARALRPIATQDQIGVYVQDQIKFRELATLVAGVRRDRAVGKATGSEDDVTKATIFRAGLIVTPVRGLAPYVSYSESFQPIAGLDYYGARFRPQRGRQWEAGIKWQPMPAALLTLAAFDIRETNRQATDPNNPLNTVQTGRARSRGIEAEASYTLPNDFTLTAAYSHVDAKVLESSFPAEIDEQLGEVPKHTASAWLMKAFRQNDRMQLRLGAGVRYVGPLISTGDALQIRTPDYTLVDGLAELDFDRFVLSARASNLFDKRYFAACRVYGDCFTGNGRTVIASLGYRF